MCFYNYLSLITENNERTNKINELVNKIKEKIFYFTEKMVEKLTNIAPKNYLNA